MSDAAGQPSLVVEPTNEIIRPDLGPDDARKLVSTLYGLVASDVAEFVSYDDKNFLVTVPRLSRNAPVVFFGGSGAHSKADGGGADGETDNNNDIDRRGDDDCEARNADYYVLKVLNSLGSKAPDLVRGQNAVMTAAAAAGISTPRLVLNLHGEEQSLERIRGKKHIVRLLTFLPGVILHKVPYEPELLFEYGKFVGKVDEALEGFTYPGFEGLASIWFLQAVPQLRKFLDVGFLEQWKVDLVRRTIEEFEEKMEAAKKREKLKRGMIHGDCNEQNILVTPSEACPGKYEISGILDWGDTHYDYYVCEIALAMTYAMIDSNVVDQVEAGGHALAGYMSVRALSREEWSLIPICICARLCQSLVMGAYTNMNEPDNTYVLTTAAKGWDLLAMLRRLADNEVLAKFSAILETYGLSLGGQ